VLQLIRRLLIRSDSFRVEREFAGPDFHRERCALPRHAEQSSGEFASADPMARAQDATLAAALRLKRERLLAQPEGIEILYSLRISANNLSRAGQELAQF
jgi:hypothetical protein